ncbi:hypothetical protein OROHE_003050 [Orobanche hederae]
MKLGKRRALSDLLKLLESLGLKKRRTTVEIVLKNIKEVKSRKILVDEGLGQVVEVEQAAIWRFLWWSGTISVHVLVEQNTKIIQEVQHLLSTQSEHSSGNVNVGFSNIKSSSPEVTWKRATEYYFKSTASVEYLEEICLNFHKDFTLEQVRRLHSYVDHLIEIQQEQRAFTYNFSEQLECLRQCMWPLSNLFSSEKDGSPSTDDCSFMNDQ